MKVTKLGIEWGAAFAEAQPIKVKHGNAEFEAFVTERHDVCVELPANAVITWNGKGFTVIISND